MEIESFKFGLFCKIREHCKNVDNSGMFFFSMSGALS